MEATNMDWLLIILLVVGVVAGFGYGISHEETVIELEDDQVEEAQKNLDNVKQSNS